MKLRSLALLPLVFVLLSITAHAQTGIYLNPVADRVSNSQADSQEFAFLGPGKTSQMFYGIQFGGYYDFKHTSPIGLGLEMRDSHTYGNSAMLNSFLAGVRLTAKPLARPFKFYVEPTIGLGTTRTPSSPRRKSNFQFGVYGGVDYPVQKHIDWRIAEVGFSSLRTINSTDFGYAATATSSKLVSISTGLVFRF